MSSLSLSVFMVVYNHELYVETSIKSVLDQKTDFPVKLFIGDDCSTDGTREILLSYQQKYPERIFLLMNDRNLGPVGNARQVYYACFRSGAKYIAMIEGDDYWTDPLKLQKQVDFLEKNPEYSVSFHNAMVYDKDDNLVSSSKLPEDCQRDFSGIEMMKGAFLLSISLCFRNVLKEIPPEMGHTINGDTFLISMLGRYGKAKYQSEINPAVYRIHPGGAWSSLLLYSRNKSSRDSQYQLYLYHKRMKSPGEVIYHFTYTYLYYSFELAQHEFSQGKYILSMARYLKLLFRALQMGSPKYFRRYLVKPVYLITRGKNKPEPIVS